MTSYYKDKSLKPDERELNTIAAYKKLHILESENAALKKQNKKYHEALEYLSDIRNQNLGLSEFSSSEALQELFDIVEKTAEEVL